MSEYDEPFDARTWNESSEVETDETLEAEASPAAEVPFHVPRD